MEQAITSVGAIDRALAVVSEREQIIAEHAPAIEKFDVAAHLAVRAAQSVLRRSAPDRNFSETDEQRRPQLRRESNLALRLNRARARMQLGRARSVVRDQFNFRFAVRERDELLARADRVLFSRRRVCALLIRAVQIRHVVRRNDQLIRARGICLRPLRVRLVGDARLLHRQQATRRDFERDGRIGRRMTPSVECTHAHDRSIAAVGLQLFAIRGDLKSHSRAAPKDNLLDGCARCAVGTDGRDAQMIRPRLQVDADETISRRLALVIHALLADVRIAYARALDLDCNRPTFSNARF